MSHGPPDLPIHLIPPLGGLLSTRGGHGKGLQPCFTIREDLTDRAWRGGWWAEPWPDTWTLVSIDTRTPPTRSTLPHSTLRHAQTRPTRLICPTTLRHRSDTGQTPPTPSTPVSIDTAPTLLRHYFDTPRHYSDTSDTSDTQTHQGSRRSCWQPFAAVSRRF